MSQAAYLLSALTAGLCAYLLLRGPRRAPLLFWGGICFIALAAESLLVFVDLVLLPQIDIRLWRTLIGLAGVAAFLYGLIWHAELEDVR